MDWCRTCWIRAGTRAKGRVAWNKPWLHISRSVSVLLLLLVCNTAAAELNDRGVVHTVYLWLQDPGNPQHRIKLLTATERLRTIPGVLEIRYGEVIESDRTIVDDSFDVGIYFYFSDVAAMNRYLVHPLHKQVVEQDIKPLVERIVIHDFHDARSR
jgi:hypothetical protein